MIFLMLLWRVCERVAYKALERLEYVVTGTGRCVCGCDKFLVCDLEDPDNEGTVVIDGVGNVVGVNGLLYCSQCGELFDPDAEPVAAERTLRLVVSN